MIKKYDKNLDFFSVLVIWIFDPFPKDLYCLLFLTIRLSQVFFLYWTGFSKQQKILHFLQSCTVGVAGRRMAFQLNTPPPPPHTHTLVSFTPKDEQCKMLKKTKENFESNFNWCYWLNYWHSLISKDTSSFTSTTLLIRFSKKSSVYIVYRMYKVMRRMVK